MLGTLAGMPSCRHTRPRLQTHIVSSNQHELLGILADGSLHYQLQTLCSSVLDRPLCHMDTCSRYVAKFHAALVISKCDCIRKNLFCKSGCCAHNPRKQGMHSESGTHMLAIHDCMRVDHLPLCPWGVFSVNKHCIVVKSASGIGKALPSQACSSSVLADGSPTSIYAGPKCH